MWKVPLFELNYDDSEARAVESVIASRWLTMGDRVSDFEKAFSEYLGGATDAVATSSGTGALHLALLAAGVRPGDHVLVPALTFVADANVVRQVGATPVFVDCTSLDDWNICPKDVATKMTPKTTAIIVVHYAGYPADVDAIKKVVESSERRRDWNGRCPRIIEDAAHAPGAHLSGRACGTVGDLGCFSFFSNKNLSIGEGGMLVSSDPELARRGRLLRSHGMTTLTLDRHRGRATTYDVVESGLNYRLDEIRAALGIEQLKKLPAGNRRRAELTGKYRRQLSRLAGIEIPFGMMDPRTASHHIMPILAENSAKRAQIMSGLKQRGVQTSIHYPSFASFSAYRAVAGGQAPIAEEVCSRELTLPLYPSMTDEQCEYVCRAICEVTNR